MYIPGIYLFIKCIYFPLIVKLKLNENEIALRNFYYILVGFLVNWICLWSGLPLLLACSSNERHTLSASEDSETNEAEITVSISTLMLIVQFIKIVVVTIYQILLCNTLICECPRLFMYFYCQNDKFSHWNRWI